MEAFITTNPAVIKWMLGTLVSFIGILIVVIVAFGKVYVKDLSATIKAFNAGLDIIKLDSGVIKDRLQRQETICEMQRQFCPYYQENTRKVNGNTKPMLVGEPLIRSGGC